MRPYGCLVVDLYPTTPDSCRLRTIIFPGENNQLHPNGIFHTISPIVESFKKKNYMESAELQAMHNCKKQMDTLMGPIPVIQEQTEIGPISQKERHTGTKEYILTRVNHLCS